MDALASFRKFELRGPSHQNAVDIFQGKWASDFSEVCPGLRAGQRQLFTLDTRPRNAARVLGVNGRLDGMRVLELGPLEGAHTYQLEKLGAASVLAIEANAEAFLKCLITKEITDLRVTKFMHGDFLEYLKITDEKFDLVFCSGVLYHMPDPLILINSIARVTKKCFVWTHYYDKEYYPGAAREPRFDPRYPGVRLHALDYNDVNSDQFWGGNRPTSIWLERHDIISAFHHAGFREIEVIDEALNHPNGACFSFAAR
jgi:SAM-dependent methyltransferase